MSQPGEKLRLDKYFVDFKTEDILLALREKMENLELDGEHELAEIIGKIVDYFNEGYVELGDESLLAVLDLKLLNGNWNDNKELLKGQIFALAIALNLGGEIEYSKAELEKFAKVGLSDGYDYGRLLQTVRSALMGQDRRSFALLLMPVLTLFIEKKEVEPEALLLEILLLRLFWSCFFDFKLVLPEFLVKNYFYRSIVMGLPVREYISRQLLDSANIEEYVARDAVIIDWLSQSLEKVIIKDSELVEHNFADLLKKYYQENPGEEKFAVDKQRQYLEKIVEGKLTDKYFAWLMEAFNIAVSLKGAHLVEYDDFEKRRHDNDVDNFLKDLVKLFEWFLSEKDWGKIVDYFGKGNNRVKLGTFLYQCSSRFDLNSESTVSRFLNFTQLLKDNSIVDVESEVIIFDETTGKFHWNEEVLK